VNLLGLTGQTVLLGLAAALTPSLFALQVLVVAQDPWRRRALAVAAGGSLAFLVVGVLLLLGLVRLGQVLSDDVAEASGAWLRIVCGAALVVIAAVLWRPHPGLRDRMEADLRGYAAHASVWVFFGIAFALSIKDVSSFVVMAPALRDIAAAPEPLLAQALLVVLFFGLALLPVLAPPAMRLVLGHRADRPLARLYEFVLSHQLQLVAAMAAVAAVFLLVSGIARLV
jgi:hypothetical protein